MAQAILRWIVASFTPWARLFASIGVGLFAVLVFLGFLPSLNPLQWWVPLDGAVVWFHVLTLAVLMIVVMTTPRTITQSAAATT